MNKKFRVKKKSYYLNKASVQEPYNFRQKRPKFSEYVKGENGEYILPDKVDKK